MCEFPINFTYTKEYPKLDEISSSHMYSLLGRLGFKIKKFKTSDDIENHIFKLIEEYDYLKSTNEKLKNIFHLIHVWGGRTGRNVYINNGGFKNNINIDYYKKLVHLCLTYEEDTEENLLTGIVEFDLKSKNIGISFITKHIRFWLYKKLKENTLPIFDSVMSINLMNSKPKFSNLLSYWKCMKKKSDEERISLMSLERQLFNHFSR